MSGDARLESRGLKSALLASLAVTPSGALSPGPLSASAVAAGTLLGVKGGILVALGHLIVEVPYIMLLLRFFDAVGDRLRGKERLINVVAAAFIAYFAYLLAREGLALARGSTLYTGSSVPINSSLGALAAGVILTGGNAYFLLWWLSVGKPIIDGMRNLDTTGKALVYAAHYSYDVAWLAVLSLAGYALTATGAVMLGYIYIALAAILVYFAVKLLAG